MAKGNGGIFWKAVGRTLFALVLFYGAVIALRVFAGGKTFKDSL